MAMRQAGERTDVCTSFSEELDSWISYILKRKIKFGMYVFIRKYLYVYIQIYVCMCI
jgi:hypothetical protein